MKKVIPVEADAIKEIAVFWTFAAEPWAEMQASNHMEYVQERMRKLVIEELKNKPELINFMYVQEPDTGNVRVIASLVTIPSCLVRNKE